MEGAVLRPPSVSLVVMIEFYAQPEGALCPKTILHGLAGNMWKPSERVRIYITAPRIIRGANSNWWLPPPQSTANDQGNRCRGTPRVEGRRPPRVEATFRAGESQKAATLPQHTSRMHCRAYDYQAKFQPVRRTKLRPATFKNKSPYCKSEMRKQACPSNYTFHHPSFFLADAASKSVPQ